MRYRPLALCLVLTGCVSVPAGQEPVASMSRSDAATDQKVECKKEVPTGSLLGTKRCTTAAQRAEEQKQAKESADRMQTDKTR